MAENKIVNVNSTDSNLSSNEAQDSVKKYEKILDLVKNGYEDEIERFRRIDDKAFRYLTLFGLFSILFSLGGKITIDTFLPPREFIDYLALFSISAVAVFLILTLVYILKIIRTQNYEIINVEGLVENEFKEQPYVDVLWGTSLEYVDVYKDVQIITDAKLRFLKWVERYAKITIIYAISLLIIVGVKSWINKKPEVYNIQGTIHMIDSSQNKPSDSTGTPSGGITPAPHPQQTPTPTTPSPVPRTKPSPNPIRPGRAHAAESYDPNYKPGGGKAEDLLND